MSMARLHKNIRKPKKLHCLSFVVHKQSYCVFGALRAYLDNADGEKEWFLELEHFCRIVDELDDDNAWDSFHDLQVSLLSILNSNLSGRRQSPGHKYIATSISAHFSLFLAAPLTIVSNISTNSNIWCSSHDLQVLCLSTFEVRPWTRLLSQGDSDRFLERSVFAVLGSFLSVSDLHLGFLAPCTCHRFDECWFPSPTSRWSRTRTRTRNQRSLLDVPGSSAPDGCSVLALKGCYIRIHISSQLQRLLLVSRRSVDFDECWAPSPKRRRSRTRRQTRTKSFHGDDLSVEILSCPFSPY